MRTPSPLPLIAPTPPRVDARFVSDLFDDATLYDALRLAHFLEAHWAPHSRAPGLCAVRKRLPRVVLREAVCAVSAVRDAVIALQDLSPALCRAECDARLSLDALDAALTYLFDDDTARDAGEDLALMELHAARDRDDDPLCLADNLRAAVALAERFATSLAMLDDRWSRDALPEALERAAALEQRVHDELPLRPELDAALMARSVHARHLGRCLIEIERAAAYVFRRAHCSLPAEAARRYRPRDEQHAEPRTRAEVR